MNLNLQCVPNNNNNIWFMYVASSAVGRVLKWMLAGCVWLALLPWADVYSPGKRVCQKLHPLPWFTATQLPRNRHKHRLQEIISVRWSSTYYTGKGRQQSVSTRKRRVVIVMDRFVINNIIIIIILAGDLCFVQSISLYHDHKIELTRMR